MSESSSAEGPVAVIKIGGSILTSARAYRRAAIFPQYSQNLAGRTAGGCGVGAGRNYGYA